VEVLLPRLDPEFRVDVQEPSGKCFCLWLPNIAAGQNMTTGILDFQELGIDKCQAPHARSNEHVGERGSNAAAPHNCHSLLRECSPLVWVSGEKHTHPPSLAPSGRFTTGASFGNETLPTNRVLLQDSGLLPLIYVDPPHLPN